MASSSRPAGDRGSMTQRQINLVIVGLLSATFLSSISQTVIATAMRTIADDLQGLDQQVWVVTAFLVVSTVVTPIYGKLSDVFGRRPLFLIAICLFLIGSVLCSFATSMPMLALFRGIQGLGAGGLMSLPLAIFADILPPRERAKYQGYFMAVFGVSSVVGPLVGGLFAGIDTFLGMSGWRLVFLFNVPIGIVALWLVTQFLHLPRQPRDVVVDWWGAAAVIVGVAPLLVVAEQGRTWGWTSPLTLGLAALGIAGIVAFILIERRMGDDAIIPLHLFRSGDFSLTMLLSVVMGVAMFSVMMMIPLELQIVHGMTPTVAGLAQLPMVVGMLITSLGVGQWIARTGKYQRMPMYGAAILVAAAIGFALLQYNSPYWHFAIPQFLAGLGLGILMQPLNLAAQNSVEMRDMGVATSAATFFRQVGGTAGTAVVFSLLYGRLPNTMQSAFEDAGKQEGIREALADPEVLADPANERIIQLLQQPDQLTEGMQSDSSFLIGADDRLTAPFLDGFHQSIAATFWFAAAAAAVAFAIAVFFRPSELRHRSSLEPEARAGDAEDAQQG